MTNFEDSVIVMCPPYPEYMNQPSDQSECTLFDCPKCKGKMWLSQKKKGVLMFASCLGKNIILGCHNCIKKLILENPEIIADLTQIDLTERKK